VKHRTLGKTGLLVSEIGFGTGDNAGLMMNGSRQQRTEAVGRALEAGVNYFDTSPDYGKGVAEENLGQILKELHVADVIVATKVEIMADQLDDMEAAIERSLDASLRRLQRDDVEILMIHNPPRLERDAAAAHWFPLTPGDLLGPALAGLRRIRAKGKVRHFGFTCEGAEAAAVRTVVESGCYGVINAWYNLVNPSAGMVMPAGVCFGDDYEDYAGMISHAAMAGAGVAAIRPLAGGALASAVVQSGAAARHPLAGGLYTRRPETFEREARRGRAFAFLESPERTLARAAFRFVLMNRDIATVVGGFSDLRQFQELVDAAADPPLTDAELAEIQRIYTHNFCLGDS
jgi:aryl-alcohol dehydrogenase-like predicted oxidoreductase